MIEIQPHAEGSLLGVRAQPNARKNAVLGEKAGLLQVAVSAPPEDGKANAALVEVLREFLLLKRSQIDLASGASSRLKKILIRGLAPEELHLRIQTRLS